MSLFCRHVRFNEAGDPYQTELKDVVPRVITELRKSRLGEYEPSKAKAAICLVDGPDFNDLFLKQLSLDGGECRVLGGIEWIIMQQEQKIKELAALAAVGDVLRLDAALSQAIEVKYLLLLQSPAT